MTKESQRKIVKAHLIAGNKLSQREADRLCGTTRLASIIHVLIHKENMTILSNMHKFHGNNYAVYEYIPLYKKEIKEPNNWIPSFDL
jgi:hypothetical protein